MIESFVDLRRATDMYQIVFLKKRVEKRYFEVQVSCAQENETEKKIERIDDL